MRFNKIFRHGCTVAAFFLFASQGALAQYQFVQSVRHPWQWGRAIRRSYRHRGRFVGERLGH